MRPAWILLAAMVLRYPCWCAPDDLVEGVVVDSKTHAPVRDMRVLLAPTTARDSKSELFTGEGGRFSFRVSHPGKYTLTLWKPGYPLQAFKQSPVSGYSSAIVVNEGQDTRHIVFEAKRGAVVAGQIKDEDGEPVGRALVGLYRAVISGGERTVVPAAQTRANRAGEFRIHNLRPGNYYVCAMGRPWFADSIIQANATSVALQRLPVRLAQQPGQGEAGEALGAESPREFSADPSFRGTAFLTTFYPGAQTLESATAVFVDAGSEAQIQMVLPFSQAVSVKGQIHLPSGASTGQVVLNKKVYKSFMDFLNVWIGPDGSFELKNIPPGSYELVASSQSSSGSSSWVMRQPVEVGTADLELQISALPKDAFSGKVLFNGEAPATRPPLFVSVRNENNQGQRTEVAPDGTFRLQRLAAGQYEVISNSANSISSSVNYVPAYLVGPDGEKLPLKVDIAPGAEVHNDLVLTRAVASIDGMAVQNGLPAVGVFVLLMPKDASKRWSYRADQTDSDGSFRLAAIPTGDYFAIALSKEEGVVYRDAKVAAILAGAGKQVHVEGEAKLELKLEVVDAATLKLPAS